MQNDREVYQVSPDKFVTRQYVTQLPGGPHTGHAVYSQDSRQSGVYSHDTRQLGGPVNGYDMQKSYSAVGYS